MNDDEIDILTAGSNDFYARVAALEGIFQEILKPLKEGDVLLMEGDNGARSYMGLWDGFYIPKEQRNGSAKIPFVLNNKSGAGFGIPIKFQNGTLREVIYNSFKETSSENVNLTEDTCAIYSDFKAYAGTDDVDKQLRSKQHNTTFKKFLESLGDYRNEKQNMVVSYYEDILADSFKDIRVRINALSALSRDVICSLEEGDELRIENDLNGAPSYSGIVKKVCLPPETYKGTAAIPFLLDEYGLGIPVKFKSPINRGIIYSDSILSVRKRGG